MKKDIFNRDLDDYLNEISEVDILEIEDLQKIKADYEEDIIQHFKNDKYTFLYESKEECLKDFFHKKRLELIFDEAEFDLTDLVNMIEWSNNDEKLLVEIEEQINNAKQFTSQLKETGADKIEIKEFISEMIENLQEIEKEYLNDIE